tara:strand:- start:391 stop:2934 length:2544 start_codon:yes stop_codon:yes gene_type:complete
MNSRNAKGSQHPTTMLFNFPRLEQHVGFRSLTLSLAVVAAVSNIPNAYSQGTPFIEEVIVTARARAESVLDVPGTVKVLSSQDLESAVVQRAEDIMSLTSGVTMMSANVDAGDVQVSIRGLNSIRDGTSGFGYLIDDVLYANSRTFNREFVNLQQIEIVKGPQGAVYGRNAASGAIIITTQKPDEERAGHANFNLGNNNLVRFNGAVSGPIIDNKLMAGAYVSYFETDGEYTNEFTGRDSVDDFESSDITLRGIWTPAENTEVDFKYRYSDVDGSAVRSNVSFLLPGFVPALGPKAWEDVNDHDYRFNGNVDSDNGQKIQEFSLKVTTDFEAGTLRVWGLYSDADEFLIGDGAGVGSLYFENPACRASTAELTGFPLTAPGFVGTTPEGSVLMPFSPTTCDGWQYQEREQQDLSFEMRFISNQSRDLRWMVGTYYLDEDRRAGVGQSYDDGRESFPKALVNELSDSLLHDEFKTEAWAVFSELVYNVTPDVELALAVRYDKEKKIASSLVPADARSRFVEISPDAGQDGFQGGFPLNPGLVNFGPNGEVLGFKSSLPDRDESFDQWQPKATVRWSLSDEFTVFASWGVGYKTGGFNNQGSEEIIKVFVEDPLGIALNINNDYDKEVSSSFELGFKSRLMDNRLSLDGSIYHTEVDDFQFFNFFTGTFGLLRIATNIDEVVINGAELEGKYQITSNLSFYASGALIEGEIKKNTNRPSTEGNEVPAAPEYTVNAGFEFNYPLAFGGGDLEVVGRLDYALTGPTWDHSVQDQLTVVGGDFSKSQRDEVGLINARLGFGALDLGWSLAIYGKNLTDEIYPTEVIGAPEGGAAFIQPALGRTYGIDIRYNF